MRTILTTCSQYCEFGGTVKKCQDWLQSASPQAYNRLWSADALEASTATLSVDARKRAEKDAHKKALKAEAQEEKIKATIKSSKVIIKRVERNKRKFVTAVSGVCLPNSHIQRSRCTSVWGLVAWEEMREKGCLGSEPRLMRMNE